MLNNLSIKSLEKEAKNTTNALKGLAPGAGEFGQAAAQLRRVQAALRSERVKITNAGRGESPGFTL